MHKLDFAHNFSTWWRKVKGIYWILGRVTEAFKRENDETEGNLKNVFGHFSRSEFRGRTDGMIEWY